MTLVGPAVAWGEDYRIKVETDASKNFHWTEDQEAHGSVVQIQSVDVQAGKVSAYVDLNAIFDRDSGSMLYLDKKIEATQKNEFTIRVPIESEATEFEIDYVNDSGKIKKKKGTIHFPEWKAFQERVLSERKKKLIVTPGLGITAVTIQQTGVQDISELSPTLKVSVQYSFRDYWDVAGNAFVSVLPFLNSPSTDQIRFLGINGRIGYSLKRLVKDPWSVKILGGFYYTTTFPNQPTFGYSNIIGLQLYPQLGRTFARGDYVWIYGKYSPILNTLPVFSLSNTELAAGGGYSFPKLKSGRVISVTLDIALLRFTLGSVSIQANSYTLGVGLTL